MASTDAQAASASNTHASSASRVCTHRIMSVSLLYCGRLFRPTGWGSFSESIWNPNLVAITTWSRMGARASPTSLHSRRDRRLQRYRRK
jgi:hypothetical protein